MLMVEVIMKRRGNTSEAIVLNPHAEGSDMLERWPVLASWFCDPAYDDGTLRKSGWAGISCRDGLWHCLMKDEGEGLQILLSAPSPLALLDVMESALCDPKSPWRPIPAPHASAGRKKLK